MLRVNLDEPVIQEQPSKPAPVSESPVAEPGQTLVTRGQPQLLLWAVLALVGINCFLLGQRFSHTPSDRHESVSPNDEKQSPDDRKSTANLRDISIVVIHDKDTTNSTPEYQSALQDDQFAAWCKQNIKDLEVFTAEDEIAKKVISSGIKIPAVIAYTGKKYLWDMPLPKTNMDAVRKKLEGR